MRTSERQPGPSRSGPPPRCTRREREVLTLIARGLTNRQIADTLGIGERTVEMHSRNVRRKLGLTTRVQVAVWAVERGWVGPRRRQPAGTGPPPGDPGLLG